MWNCQSFSFKWRNKLRPTCRLISTGRLPKSERKVSMWTVDFLKTCIVGGIGTGTFYVLNQKSDCALAHAEKLQEQQERSNMKPSRGLEHVDEASLDHDFDLDKGGSQSRTGGISGWKIAFGMAGFVAAVGCLAGPFMAPALRKYCLPFVPAEKSQLRTLMKTIRQEMELGNAGVSASNMKLVDIGSGDGRVVIEAAKVLGVRASGEY